MPVDIALLVPPRPPLDLLTGLVVGTTAQLPPGVTHLPLDLTTAAEFLARDAHDDGPGFVVGTNGISGDGAADFAVAAIAGTVAALSGADIPAALARPNIDRLRRLSLPAQSAVRERLRHVVAAFPDELAAELRMRLQA